MNIPKCPICGAITEWSRVIEYDKRTGTCIRERLPRVCAVCDSSKPSGRRMTIPKDGMPGAFALAAAVIKKVMDQYGMLYRTAVDEHVRSGMLSEEFEKFAWRHREILERDIGYYNILTLERTEGLMAEAIRLTNRDMLKKCRDEEYGAYLAAIRAVRKGMGWYDEKGGTGAEAEMAETGMSVEDGSDRTGSGAEGAAIPEESRKGHRAGKRDRKGRGGACGDRE